MNPRKVSAMAAPSARPGTSRENVVRKNFEFSPQTVDLIHKLQEICAIRTEREVLEEGLALLSWAVTEVRKNRTVGSFNEADNRLREITTRALTAARDYTPDLNR